ncbi:hypothetical protein WH50_14000 [Pokkaliibacter plantistimulans]|uniref:Uncharacterized protein n=1 Tax=Pokkaliibacter plantistimulans TaxID=1635171 RepID=A0ABX5LZT8_9GAMM|nr:hypothetical protein [Pokkaliibacter plantistimulans]PXF30703.1 hypothetical protein WH50_14000 [Pokkaliibacter plantistimulans]
MILSKPFDKGDLVDFDASIGVVNSNVDVSVKPKGNFHLLDQRCLAIYCEDNVLILQMDRDKWELSSADVELRYFHNLANRTTCFEVKSPKKSVSIEYKTWWAEIPGFEPVEPEMDEDEDFLGYVFSVWKNKQLQGSLISNWA